MTTHCNITIGLRDQAKQAPQQTAIRCPGKRGKDGFASYDIELSYQQLEQRSNAIAAGLIKQGIVRGSRVVVMVRPSPEFFLVMFALFKMGAVPVLVDPGIDRRALQQCLSEAEPHAFIGISLAHAARLLLGWAKTATTHITVGRRWFWGGKTLAQIERAGAGADSQLADTQADDVAAVVFTSGSTGVPKGVVYRHRHLVQQISVLRDVFGMQAGGVDLSTFPPFALYDPALGMTSVVPDMDPTRPGEADPVKLHHAIKRFGVAQLFGSPALMRVLAEYNQPLPTIQRAYSAGAPVPPEIVAKLRELMPENAQFWTPYGATECLPVALVESRQLEQTRAATEAGAGTCVGTPVPMNEVRIIAIDDDAIEQWRDDLCLPTGVVGEITVAGPAATDSYYNRPDATRIAKISETLADGSQRIVHRMGDTGYFDEQGLLWFCGRKTQRVKTTQGPMYTEQVEPVFNTIAAIKRTALVGVGEMGQQIPVLCYEFRADADETARTEILTQLQTLAKQYPHTQSIQHFLCHPSFPVDIRHNAKIGREKLAVWADEQIKRSV